MIDLNEVIENCKEYIEILQAGEKGCFLIRGIQVDDIDIKLFPHSVEFRKPRDTHIDLHNAINEHFENQFGWKVRNGVFTYGTKTNGHKLTTHYGTTYLIFPCGKFTYVYDSEIYDLTGTYNEFERESCDFLKEFIKSIYYTNKELSKAIANIIFDKKSAEIIINCKEYYLVNLEYIDELTNLIWGNSKI